MTNSQKHLRRRRTTKVADMTTEELQKMIDSSVKRQLSQMFKDPDAGLELQADIAESLLRQEKEFAEGKRGKSIEEVVALIPNPCPLTPSPGDPDAGLELRPEFIVSITSSIERQSIEYAAGKRGKSLDEVIKQLGLE